MVSMRPNSQTKDTRALLYDLVVACRSYDSTKPAHVQEYSFALDAAEAFLQTPRQSGAKLIAELQTHVPLPYWPLVDELAGQSGPAGSEVVADAILAGHIEAVVEEGVKTGEPIEEPA